MPDYRILTVSQTGQERRAMADIHYSPEDIVNTRFNISPMAVATFSANIAFNAPRHPMYSRWSDYVAETLRDLPLPILQDFHQGTSCTPEFLSPVLPPQTRSFEDELNHVATMSEDLIESEIDWIAGHAPPEASLKVYQKRPLMMREDLIVELSIYWEYVVAPHWQQMRSILETEIMQQSQILATQGHTAMFAHLSPDINVSDHLLMVQTSSIDLAVELSGGGLILEPNIFASRLRLGMSGLNPCVVLSYPARGSGNWRSKPATHTPEALSLMLGQNRAMLLIRLVEPATTQGLATELNLTPGAVSQQLSQLHEADLVKKQRSGKRVYYSLTQRGLNLLEVFETAG